MLEVTKIYELVFAATYRALFSADSSNKNF